MEIFHASDLHYGESNLVEADRCFGYAVDQAIERNVQVGIITGDSTDHTLQAHSPAFFALAKRVRQLADHCPVLLLQGTFSHEPAGMLHVLSLLGSKHPILVCDQIGMIGLAGGIWSQFDPHVSTTYDLVVTAGPTVNKADLAAVVGAQRAGEAMGDYLAALLRSFAPSNEQLRAQGVPTVMVGHGTVDGSMSESGVAMVGLDHEFNVGALFSAMTTATMLGHIHTHQLWSRTHNNVEQMIAYPGAIGCFHYGEIGKKNFLVWKVEAAFVSLEAIPTPSRTMIDIVFPGAPDMHEIAKVALECKGAYVRLAYAVDAEYASTIDRRGIKELLNGVADLKIEGTILPIQRQRCAGISALSSLEDRFLQWAEHTDTPIEGLIERLSELQVADPIDIAAAFRRRNIAHDGTQSRVERVAQSTEMTSAIY